MKQPPLYTTPHTADNAALTNSVFVTKSRGLWDPRSLESLREPGAVRFAGRIVQPEVRGYHIVLPEVAAVPGFHISVHSRRLPGRCLFDMLYDVNASRLTTDLAMIALEALDRAVVPRTTGTSFHLAYDIVRWSKLVMNESFGRRILDKKERARLFRLLKDDGTDWGTEQKQLVHGNLHAGHIIVDFDTRTLGIVDWELMHVGRSLTNFAQLWVSFEMASPALGHELYSKFREYSLEEPQEGLAMGSRAEAALELYFLAKRGRELGNQIQEKRARNLLLKVLQSDTLAEIC